MHWLEGFVCYAFLGAIVALGAATLGLMLAAAASIPWAWGFAQAVEILGALPVVAKPAFMFGSLSGSALWVVRTTLR